MIWRDFHEKFEFCMKIWFLRKISWVVIEKLVKSSWDKIIWGKLLSTSAGMLFLYCNMSFWQVFYDEICIFIMYSNNLAPIYNPTLIWQVFSTKNIGGKLLSTSAGMEFLELSKHKGMIFLQQLSCGYRFPALIHAWIASAVVLEWFTSTRGEQEIYTHTRAVAGKSQS
jgi:hypothetical protein